MTSSDLKNQRRMAAQVLGVGKHRLILDSSKAKEISEAITKADIRALIVKGFIKKAKEQGQSRGRARKRHEQRKKGRQRGIGKRKGKKSAKNPKKKVWMKKVRLQRKLISKLKENKKIDNETFKKLYGLVKGDFFRTKAHLKLYLQKIGVFK